jgi:hypothetical protein
LVKNYCFLFIFIFDNQTDIKCSDVINSIQCESDEIKQQNLSCVWNGQCEDRIPYIEEKNEEKDPNIEDKNPSKSNSTTVIIMIIAIVVAVLLIGGMILVIIIIYRRKVSGRVKDGERTSEMDELRKMSSSSSIQKSQRKTGLYCD